MVVYLSDFSGLPLERVIEICVLSGLINDPGGGNRCRILTQKAITWEEERYGA
jgi:hypothetical protein